MRPLSGLDHRHAHVRLAGRKGRIDMKYTVDSLRCGTQACRVTEVADNRLVCPLSPGDAGLDLHLFLLQPFALTPLTR